MLTSLQIYNKDNKPIILHVYQWLHPNTPILIISQDTTFLCSENLNLNRQLFIVPSNGVSEKIFLQDATPITLVKTSVKSDTKQTCQQGVNSLTLIGKSQLKCNTSGKALLLSFFDSSAYLLSLDKCMNSLSATLIWPHAKEMLKIQIWFESKPFKILVSSW